MKIVTEYKEKKRGEKEIKEKKKIILFVSKIWNFNEKNSTHFRIYHSVGIQ